MESITPKKCLIVASGVHNHSEFVELVKERLGELLPVPEHLYERKPAEYIGGEYRNWTETPDTNIMLAFESVPWKDRDVPACHVMGALLGESNSFGDRIPGLGFNRAHQVILNKNYVDLCQGLNHHFSDSGIFGINIEGQGSHSEELMNTAIETLSDLKNPIGDEELSRAKNSLKMGIMRSLETQESRLEEMARNYQAEGELNLHKQCDMIDSVSAEDVNRIAEKIFSGKPTMVVTGGAINLVPNITDVQRQLN